MPAHTQLEEHVAGAVGQGSKILIRARAVWRMQRSSAAATLDDVPVEEKGGDIEIAGDVFVAQRTCSFSRGPSRVST